jgi:small GTP-binding protein
VWFLFFFENSVNKKKIEREDDFNSIMNKKNKTKKENKRKQKKQKMMKKIVLAGGGGVGKSSLTIRACFDQFVEEYDPTLEDSHQLTLKLDDDRVERVSILDTAGQEEFSALHDQWWRGGDGFVVVFSITDAGSFEEAQAFRESILRSKDEDTVPMVLVGSKSDLESERAVPRQDAEALANEWRVPYIECSAVLGGNLIPSVFATALRETHKHEAELDRLAARKTKKKHSACNIL